MTRKFALIVFGAVCASLVGCDKTPTGPTPTVCKDPNATNNGGPLPCVYPPPSVVEIGSVGFTGLRPGNMVGVAFPAKNYSGVVEARIVLDQIVPDPAGRHSIRLLFSNRETFAIIKASVAAPIEGNMIISLPHDGSACIVNIQNVGTSSVSISGNATFVYRKI